jgi:hypothetical protein
MRTGHDIIVRYAQLLPAGIKTADWAAARLFIASLTDERAERQLEEADEDREDISYKLVKEWLLHPDDELPDSEVWRRYLGLLVDEMEAEAQTHEPELPGHYPLDWNGRLGFVIEGYGFDEEPPDTIPCRILRMSGVLEAAGFELLP